jgi:hypothetical protein
LSATVLVSVSHTVPLESQTMCWGSSGLFAVRAKLRPPSRETNTPWPWLET